MPHVHHDVFLKNAKSVDKKQYKKMCSFSFGQKYIKVLEKKTENQTKKAVEPSSCRMTQFPSKRLLAMKAISCIRK